MREHSQDRPSADHPFPGSGNTALRANLVGGMISAHDLAQGPTAAAVRRQLERTLNEAGVERIEVHIGEPFDVDRHSVAGTEPAADPSMSRCVAREVRPGWVLGSRVLRAVDVVVWTG